MKHSTVRHSTFRGEHSTFKGFVGFVERVARESIQDNYFLNFANGIRYGPESFRRPARNSVDWGVGVPRIPNCKVAYGESIKRYFHNRTADHTIVIESGLMEIRPTQEIEWRIKSNTTQEGFFVFHPTARLSDEGTIYLGTSDLERVTRALSAPYSRWGWREEEKKGSKVCLLTKQLN